MRLHLYAIARRRRGGVAEFYVSVAGGHGIAWTEHPGDAWATEHEAWAEMVREELHRHGHVDTYVYVFHEDLPLDGGG